MPTPNKRICNLYIYCRECCAVTANIGSLVRVATVYTGEDTFFIEDDVPFQTGYCPYTLFWVIQNNMPRQYPDSKTSLCDCRMRLLHWPLIHLRLPKMWKSSVRCLLRWTSTHDTTFQFVSNWLDFGCKTI